MKKTTFFLLIVSLFSPILLASNVIKKGNSYYFADRVIIKLKETASGNVLSKSMLPTAVQKLISDININEIEKTFKSISENEESELSKIITLKLNGPYDPLYIAAKLSKNSLIEWAEPHYLHEITDTPNDPDMSKQYALAMVQAEQAWEVTKGNSNIIIGIVDTGVDWDHPDLAGNIWINSTEQNGVTGLDDDNNGFVDDIHGWDFGGKTGTPDNDPKEDKADHGTHVAGIASAVTNNGIGVASIGYNCKVMAVKTSRDDVRTDGGTALISYGYDGILYAVNNGAKVVNCSWGSYSYSNAAQEVINYAVSKGSLVVGAAGNEGYDDVIYPGRYRGALSVGYTNSNDQKSSSSNYGRDIDVMAPGQSIYSTWQNDTYSTLSGSSMASPLVAGIAGLVFSVFTDYTPLQVAEQIRATTDNIDAQNGGYILKLGSGRVNAYKAVSTTDAKSVRTNAVVFIEIGDGDGIYESGESISIEVNFTNYLNPLTSLSIQLVTDNGSVTISNGSFSPGSVGTLQSFNNSSNKFTAVISASAPNNSEAFFRVNYTDGDFSNFEWIGSVIINPLYLTQSANNTALTITSRGILGFNDYPNNLQGKGFKYENGPSLLFEGGLFYGTAADKIVSSVRSADTDYQDDDFNLVKQFLIESPGEQADEQGLSIFNDDNAGVGKLNIETELHTYSYIEEPYDNFIILRYFFKNKGTSEISNFYAGLFMDWDLDEEDYGDNIAAYDSTGKFGYIYNTDHSPVNTYVAAALVSWGSDNFHAIHNDGGDGGFSVYDGFDFSEKWTSLTSNLSKPSAGPYDVSAVSSSGSYTIPANDKIEVAFSIAAGPSLDELRESVYQSRIKYRELPTDIDKNVEQPYSFGLEQNYPNPFNPRTVIKFQVPSSKFVMLKVYDLLGKEVQTLVNEQKPAGSYDIEFNADNLSTGVYFYTLTAGNFTETKKMVLLR
ncbi:MAG: S8 family serine peptidase [Bacteroidetes bacterium]|nr:S8 family serine peptidase [Bacteroidota bacterium]